MVVKFDTPSGTTGNKGSSAAFLQYMEKENVIQQEQGLEPESWGDMQRENVYRSEVRMDIDKDHQGIKRDEGKFATGSISPTTKEWQALGSTEEERNANFKAWAREEFTKEFAGNFNGKEVKPEDVKLYFKMEENRYHKGMDEEVKAGNAKNGQVKEGFNKHIHFIVASKDRAGQRINPNTNRKKEFSRDELTGKIERNFDRHFGYDRNVTESYDYHKTMKNGTLQERVAAIEKRDNQVIKTFDQEQKNILVKEEKKHKGLGM
jgi:hypothetical protein